MRIRQTHTGCWYGETWRDKMARNPLLTAAASIAAALVLVLLMATLGLPLLSGTPEVPASAGSLEVADSAQGEAASPALGTVSSGDLSQAVDALPAGTDIVSFAAGSPQQGSLDLPEVRAALDSFAKAGYQAGFVVCDLQTGKGLASNANQPFFCASTIKGPYVASVASQLDAGTASLSDWLQEDMVMDGTGVMAFDGIDGYPLEEVLFDTIVYSDNTGYALLRETFDASVFDDWAARYNVDADAWEDLYYPNYTAGDLAKMWLGMREYFNEGTSYSEWCENLFSQTGSSFLRAALGEQMSVLAKPGYEIDTWLDDMGSLNDAGVVTTAEGRSYLVAVMSDADYDDEFYTDNEYLIANLITALAASFDQLA